MFKIGVNDGINTCIEDHTSLVFFSIILLYSYQEAMLLTPLVLILPIILPKSVVKNGSKIVTWVFIGSDQYLDQLLRIKPKGLHRGNH
jgi:hypothetical protein